MSFTVHVDSAYVGFIFLIVTEVFLVRVISSAQIRSFERDVKHRLDKGGEVQVSLKEFGPLRVLGGTRLKTALFLALPAAALLLLVALGELGISGRTIPTYAVTDSFTAGGYFSIRKSSFQQRAPNQFQGKWPSCVDFGNDRVVGHAATIPFEILDDDSLELKDAQCSSEDDIVISSFSTRTLCESNVYYNTTSTGKVVYETSAFRGFFLNRLADFQLELGEYVFDPDRFYDTSGCPFLQNAEPDRYFWINHEGDTNYNHSCAILDASSLIESTHSEVWIVDSLILGEDSDIVVTDNVVIECEVGCFEAIIEWCLSDIAVYTISGSSIYLSIWYEGLDFSVDSSSEGIPSNDTPRCSTDDDNFWVETPLVGVGDCSSALSSTSFVDGGEENVTVISAWAVVVVTIAGVFTIVYHFVHVKGGYDLLSYEGLSKLYFKDINPESEWRAGGPLPVSMDGSIIRASRTNT